jgi:hypothetical protein
MWLDVNNKDITDPSTFAIVEEFETDPSLIGLSPELEYFKQRIPFSKPSVDPLLAYITEVITLTDDIEVVEGVDVRCYDRTFSVTLFDNDTIKDNIENIKNDSNTLVFPDTKRLEYLAMYAAINERKRQNLNITPEMEAIVEKVEAKVARIWNNHITSLTKKEAVDLGDPIDINNGWETLDPENEV